ncbi:hemerythrin domain-containing protein [Sphingomonas sp. DT-204]|uniref:hemerythrin domain-containing protein n=1 Tax=Sphingomonas sp. DT-204 TaxID=3396166 RepID=UPI003F193F0F
MAEPPPADRSDRRRLLGDAATLFRRFGEDYHERGLEERFLFPEVRRAGGEAGALVDTLLAQHRRGREVTDYILQTVGGGSIATASAEPLSRALTAMNRMYEAHAAWEDTIVFPAWKEAMPPERLHELAETFEEIEHRQFGEDGFDQAVRRVAAIEQRLGITGLAGFTAPAPGS